MKPTGVFRGVAILMFVAGLSARTDGRPAANSQSAGGDAIVAIGCVNRAVQNGSLAPEPGVPAATPETAPILANSSEPTNAFLLAGATTANATDEDRAQAAAGKPAKAPLATYVLDGARQEVERHSGNLVEVTGTLRTVKEGAAANSTTVSHIRVASIKLLSSTCPKPGAEAPKSGTSK